VDRDQVWQLVDEQRAALADLLETLAPDEWERPSLCAGWRVRDVAAHVISSPQSGFGAVSLGLMRAKGNFNRCIFDEAKRAARAPTSQIVADYRRYSGSRRRPPGTTYLDPLLDVLVHTQDIAIPLGRRHDMPHPRLRVRRPHECGERLSRSGLARILPGCYWWPMTCRGRSATGRGSRALWRRCCWC